MKNRNLVIITIILIICLLGSLSYIIYKKVLNETKIEQKEEAEKLKSEHQSKVESRALTNIEQQQILIQIKDYATALVKLYPIDEQHPITNQEALNFALVKIGTLRNNIMESEIEKILQTYFGKNHSYKHEDINCFAGDGILYKYNSAKREYIFQDTHGHGGQGTYSAEIYYINGMVEDDKYIVNVHILYGDYCGGVCGPTLSYYKTKEDSMNSQNPILGPYEDPHTITDEEYDMIKTSLPTVTFTLKKDNDNNYGLMTVLI